MCLITDQPAKVAKRNIKVYKILSKEACSIYFPFQYQLSKTYTTKIKDSSDIGSNYDRIASEAVSKKYPEYHPSRFKPLPGGTRCLGPGFHSFKTKERYFRENTYVYSNRALFECTIPKGAKYFEDIEGSLLVSDQIIIRRKLKIKYRTQLKVLQYIKDHK